MDPRFAHVRDWIFDLDNCLYPASAGLFDLIDERMGAYIQRLLDCGPAEARRVQKDHFHAHGTTLAGLMKAHDVDPHDFLADVHDVPLDCIAPDARLDRALGQLPGRKFVFTNGDAPYARRVLDALGIGAHFDDLHDIVASDLTPKPDPYGYTLLCERFGIDPAAALLADDMAQAHDNHMTGLMRRARHFVCALAFCAYGGGAAEVGSFTIPGRGRQHLGAPGGQRP